MTALPAEDLKIGDLVLLEAHVTRYSTARDNNNGGKVFAKDRAKIKAKGPSQWKVTFELCSVSLLREAALALTPESDSFSDSI